MTKVFIGTAVILLALALPAFGADDSPAGKTGPKFEEKKAQILKHIDERIARQQQEKTCVQAAKNHDELKACREKFGPPHREGKPTDPNAPGGQGGPGRGTPPQKQ